METFKQGISVNKTTNPSKNHMEEGQFSLMRKVFREAMSTSSHRNNAGSTLNLSFQDNSSYLARKKAIAIGKQVHIPGSSNQKVVSYRSYDPVYVGHVIRKQHSSGAVVPKKVTMIK
jgi:hypothetical protein